MARAIEAYSIVWQSWAEGERPRRKTIALYGDLFALKQQLEFEETAKPQELVWGIGVSAWKLPFDRESFGFEYPLLTQAVEISIDEKSMAIEVRPRATNTRLEFDAFVACQVSGAAEVERIAREHLAKHKEHPVTPFDPSSYSDVLKLAAGNLDSKGTYKEILATGEAVPESGSHLVVTDAWVLFARLRSNNFLFEDLKRLQQKLVEGCEIPQGPLELVTPPSDETIEFQPVRFRGLCSRGIRGAGEKLDELYFPLPYNDEQVTIVQRLERAPGVCVQGPPGTGKTHTIANIICHYLATGRRVLVTSRGEPALEVLQGKIPEEVRSLTVALLASDREGVRQFQASIEAIQHQVTQLNPELTSQEVERLKPEIDRAHAELARLDARVDEIAMAQLSDVSVDGAPMRAQKLAELVVAGRESFGWFDDDVELRPENAPPLNDDEAAELRSARRKLGTDLVYVNVSVPPVDALPQSKGIAALHQVLARMKEIEAQVTDGKLRPLKSVTPAVLEAARDLVARIDEAAALLAEIASLGDGWPINLRVKCRLPSFSSERKALEALFAELEKFIAARAELLKRPVEFPEAGLSSQKTLEAITRAAETGKPFGLVAFGASDAKAHIASVKVAGLAPSTPEDWAHVRRYVQLHEEIVSFTTRWNQLSVDLGIPTLEGGVNTLRKIETIANAARKAHRLAMHYDSILPKKAEDVFAVVPTKEFIGDLEGLAVIRTHLLTHLDRAELSLAATELASLQEKLAGTSGPISESLRQFIEQDLGNAHVPPERAAAAYAERLGELRRIGGLAAEVATVRDLTSRVERAGAPKFAKRLRTDVVDRGGDDYAFPVNWRQAWNWARMSAHLNSIDSRDELLALASRRRDLENGLARLYSDMVGKAAWLATKRNATPRVLQALSGYATAIRRIGQGTGPNATRYRRDAREAMLDAAGAVPCWIMSHSKISEAMPPHIGAFDLVIVDEASQSNLWALPAILRGKRILVVGDDKQVSPDAGFMAAQRIEELRNRFLVDQPYGIEMTPEKSLYDLAARVYAAHQVMLREHFRCVPPIIAYSNRVFYKGGIQPIRIPRASERLDPPLIDIYVPSGVRDRRDINADEAQVIADEIEALLSDEKFANRSLGVVSMLGIEQARHIDSVVRKRCDVAELIRRRFECGDARTFQGSERDIMFLSLVVDPSNCKAVSGNLFDQRFNVAASRARDRMYLVRSVKASELSDKDLRLSLLQHFTNPIVVDKEEAENLFERCESGFEQQVFSELTSRGYRVIPQVKTGAYRIDLVVEGEGDTRLAIECDGDEFHGPDRWQADMARQRVLERAGWVFWRCFASTWALRKDEVLGELLDRLRSMGIAPVGAIERVPNLVEKREWAPPIARGEMTANGAPSLLGVEAN
ncbi:MAG: AAA domain-containing protein [Pseudomonadota bacterium]